MEVGITPRLMGRTRCVLQVEKPEPYSRKQGPRRQVPVCSTGAHRRNGGTRGVIGTPPSRRSGRHIYPEHQAYSLFAYASARECRLCLLYGTSCSRCLRIPRQRSGGKPPLPGSLCQKRRKQTGYPVIHIEVAGHITIRNPVEQRAAEGGTLSDWILVPAFAGINLRGNDWLVAPSLP